MSDKKLRPEDLTGEERALFHQAAIALLASGNYEVRGAQLDAMEYVKSSRALFAPAPSEAKVETMADRIAADLKAGTFRGEQPAPPAPEKAAKVSAFPVGNCVVCGELVAPYNKHAKYEGGYTCQRPQPAPPAPAEREMPEAVRTISAARKYAAEFDHPTSMEFHIRVDGFVAGAKRERNLAQPVAVGMTEELRMILDVAESRAEHHRHDGLLECSRNLERAIAAVRQQAAQGRKVELGKVRAYFNTPSALRTVGDERAALAEIDAAEGKGEGRG